MTPTAARRAHLASLIRAFRQVAPAPRRKRLPVQPFPTGVAVEYRQAIIDRVLSKARALVERDLLPLLPALLPRRDGDEERLDHLVRRGSRWVLYSKSLPRRRLGTFRSEAQARDRERQILAAEAARASHPGLRHDALVHVYQKDTGRGWWVATDINGNTVARGPTEADARRVAESKGHTVVSRAEVIAAGEAGAHGKVGADVAGTRSRARVPPPPGAAAAVNRTVDRISEQFWRQLGSSELAALADEFARRTAQFQGAAFRRQVRAALGVDLLVGEPDLRAAFEAFVAENVALIKSLPDAYFADVEKAVSRAVASGQRAEDVADELQERYGVSESRAALIARDQVGKLTGRVNEDRQQALGIDRYVWRTSNDERVRPEHAEREGQVFSWSDPPEDGHPGEPIQCRCHAEPVLDELISDVAA